MATATAPAAAEAPTSRAGGVAAATLVVLDRDFYVRRLNDWKGSAEFEPLAPDGLAVYGRACGWTLARAHARSGDRVAIAAYPGGRDTFDEATLAFAQAYARQKERDYRGLKAAAGAGRIVAQPGL
jgi:hypothetical protein